MNNTGEYSKAIAGAIMGLFRDEENGGNPDYHLELDKIDLTEFITSMVEGCNFVFYNFTNEVKSDLEFTHTLNHLVVQSMLEEKENDNDFI